MIEGLISREIARVLWRSQAVKTGDFTLSSGIKSHIYIDLRSLLARPNDFSWLVLTLGTATSAVMKVHNAECILGIATGGLAWSVPVAFLLSTPFAYHRGKKKEYGLSKLVEGCNVSKRKVIVVDDVTTTGESIAKVCEDVEKLGGQVVAAVVIVDRCQGAKERLEKRGLTLYSLTDLSTILMIGVELGMLSRELYELILKEVSCRR